MDLKDDKINKLTESIGTSIRNFLIEEKSVNAAVQSTADFIVYIQEQYSHISKFKSVESDIVKYLDSYDFKNADSFDIVKNCCEALPDIEDNIAKMGQMCKSLRKRPDRYGLASVVKNCTDFSKYCAEEMGIGDVNNARNESSASLKRLQEVINSFGNEDNLLKEIKLTIKKHNILLKKYIAYENELKEYLLSFPHDNNGDMQYVKQHLQDLSDIDKKFIELEQEVELISKFVDRYDKNQVETKSKTILEQAAKNLVHSDLSCVSDTIDRALHRINKLKENFWEEQRYIQAQYDELHSGNLNMWKEDSSLICAFLKKILNKGTCFFNFSMDNLNGRKSAAVEKKCTDINNIYLKYRWLKRKKYEQQILEITQNGASYRTFINVINYIKSSRNIFTRIHEFLFW